MNFTLQLHGERHLYSVPPGLYDLMSDISREVLRDQPTFVYQYIANYLDTLVKVRRYTRTADLLVRDVIDTNKELLAFVTSFGTTWEEANRAATKLQVAFRRFKCAKDLRLKIKARQEEERMKELGLGSDSFQQFMRELDVDREEADEAATLIQTAYRGYAVRKSSRKIKTPSTHTVDAILVKDTASSARVKKRPIKRNSKLLVYQQSPRHSAESTWSTLARQLAEEEAKAFERKLVYAQTAAIEVSHPKYLESYQSVDGTSASQGTVTLPSYYDEQRHKVPMITNTGELVKEVDDDVVTLYSIDTVDHGTFAGDDTSPTIVDLDVPRSVTSHELANIIDNKSTSTGKFIESSEPLDEVVNIIEHIKSLPSKKSSMESSRKSAGAPKVSKSISKTSSFRRLSKTATKLKVDFVDDSTPS